MSSIDPERTVLLEHIHDRLGRPMRCRVATSPREGRNDRISGTILFMEALPAKEEE